MRGNSHGPVVFPKTVMPAAPELFVSKIQHQQFTMPFDPPDHSTAAGAPLSSTSTPGITFFAIPKPFTGHTAIIQCNAIRSWAALGHAADILLFGDGDALREIARETGARVFPTQDNARGTPLLSHAFHTAHACARTPVLAYLNADLILDARFLRAALNLQSWRPEGYLGIGYRTELSVSEDLAPSPTSVGLGNDVSAFSAAVKEIMHRAQQYGTRASVICKDYFIFPDTLFRDIPPFLVGRGCWDNWMVHTARKNRIPVVDLAAFAPVVHQRHDYTHLPGRRCAAYATGEEACTNRKLGRGAHIFTGSRATFLMGSDGTIQRQRVPVTLMRDIPRMLKLLWDIRPG